MKQYRLYKLLALTGILSVTAFASPTVAATSQWVDLYGGKARLSAVKDPATNIISGMVEIKLKEGWKTYWRQPGGSGIPPKIDFTGSTFFNLDKILYPVPEIGGSTDQFIGYHNSVNFVFSGQATSVDATLKLDLLAGVCEKICIPAMANFEIEAQALNQSDPKALMSLMLGKSLLPRKAHEQFSLSDIHYKDDIFSASAVLPEGLKNPTLLVEGPNGWFSGVIKLDKSLNKFSFTLPENLVQKSGPNNQFNYTLIASGQGVESALPLKDIIN